MQIVWTKATRGAPRANERAALPRAFATAPSEARYTHDRYTMAEQEAFRLVHARKVSDVLPAGDAGLLLQVDGDRLVVGLRATSGRPLRHGRRALARLACGDHARLRFNARFASYSGQYYTETIFHVGFGERWPRNRFVDARPEHDVDWMADLF
ncbi:hypothetical protein [Tahibacter caeni]|uniref:hypothetical protein n=1 Tax=Tahibacter caeni TaxID=1453545 RepID=UPI002148A987|nr:hypothetical protein [Tahibacter caeni]